MILDICPWRHGGYDKESLPSENLSRLREEKGGLYFDRAKSSRWHIKRFATHPRLEIGLSGGGGVVSEGGARRGGG